MGEMVEALIFRGFKVGGIEFITDSVVCPFCGGHAVIDHIEDFGDSLTLKIRCKDCGEEFEHDVDE